ncbi:hypothetical protein LX32DRAFT_33858 [Colletotrichum zoysiae]|uniref:Uncharacterized protein n=1 Tax=Colletotrichum zoysiae TaxID=1216348 RepID=A0AAD9LYZ6_9PEZI|nr:hypothetical protein LX32DRAFT_33858 [Colletotrichum zoysiae]
MRKKSPVLTQSSLLLTSELLQDSRWCRSSKIPHWTTSVVPLHHPTVALLTVISGFPILVFYLPTWVLILFPNLSVSPPVLLQTWTGCQRLPAHPAEITVEGGQLRDTCCAYVLFFPFSFRGLVPHHTHRTCPFVFLSPSCSLRLCCPALSVARSGGLFVSQPLLPLTTSPD